VRGLTVTLLALGLLPAAGRADVMIRVSGGQVDLTATAAPLNDILDRLARQTGMKVVYEGATPRQPVTISLRGRSPAETVLALLEGLGLNYALVGDITGTRVQTLILAGSGVASPAAARTGAGGSAGGTAPARRPFVPPPGAAPDFVAPGEGEMSEEEPEEVMPGEPGVSGPEGVNAPAVGGPADSGAVGVPGTSSPTPPGFLAPQMPQQTFPASPFTPQPFPPSPPGQPGNPASGTPPPDEAPVPTAPPPD
jgi:hypothetical protein